MIRHTGTASSHAHCEFPLAWRYTKCGRTFSHSSRSDRIIIGAALLLGGVLWLGMRLQPHWLGLLTGAAGLVVWFRVWLGRSN